MSFVPSSFWSLSFKNEYVSTVSLPFTCALVNQLNFLSAPSYLLANSRISSSVPCYFMCVFKPKELVIFVSHLRLVSAILVLHILIVCSLLTYRFLRGKLIARESKDSESLRVVLIVQLHKLGIVCVGQTSLRGNVDNTEDITLIF